MLTITNNIAQQHCSLQITMPVGGASRNFILRENTRIHSKHDVINLFH